MEIKFVFEKFSGKEMSLWEDINKMANGSSFLTSADWVSFQKALGKNTDQYLVRVESGSVAKIVGNVYIETYRRKIAKYAYCPYGPVVNWQGIKESLNIKAGEFNLKREFFLGFKQFAIDYLKKHGLNLFRIDPILPAEDSVYFSSLGYKRSFAPAQAKDLWLLDINRDFNELRKDMAGTNRNLINRATKRGVRITKAVDMDQIGQFYRLLSGTSNRKNFSTYPLHYFKKQYEMLNDKDMCDIFLAEYEGRYIAGALVNYYKDTVYYSHAGAIIEKEISKLGAPYLLIWELINVSKNRGFKFFNFWGVLPKYIKKHPMRGVSDFKMKFGGKLKRLVGPVELYDNGFGYFIHRMSDWWNYRRDRYW